ncbi:hypothetical protein NBRC111894_229 [Sporolactobacillus inulinus]|uniref:Uncharacterized protein n=1 Tax=Sporolactobacillus inulinus TaxID=2078 RepID=A0A4Y1Z6K8_9BACL|nr:hypothetical protein NBRC111894_229 [Sporolactobacillus inulinus]
MFLLLDILTELLSFKELYAMIHQSIYGKNARASRLFSFLKNTCTEN